jgi:type IV secretory pathway TrbD component
MPDGSLSAREEQARRLTETLRRQLGATLCGLMQTPDVVELMLNPDGRVLVDRLGQAMAFVCTMAPATAESLIATVASTIRSTVTRENPILECELPLVPPFHGARFEALIPPVVSPAPAFTIRRKASAVFRLEAYERQGIMTARQRAAIERAVRELAVSGQNLVTLIVAAILWFGYIGIFRQVAKADPQMSRVYLRQLKYRGYYPPRSRPYRDAERSSRTFTAATCVAVVALLCWMF